MSQLISIRTNTRFALDYESKKLLPEIELIFLISIPKYTAKKEHIVKEIDISEVRIFVQPSTLSKLIGELTALQIPVNTFQNMAEAINTIIVASEPNKD